jgi:sugar phosphate isomerase/epimerase
MKPPVNLTSRREFLAAAAAAAAAATAAVGRADEAKAQAKRSAMGVTIATYAIRFGVKAPASEKFPAWESALDVLEHCAALGAAGLQVGVRGWQADFAAKVRERREALGLYLEGQISLPAAEANVGRFESEVRAAKEAGATILRTAIGNRRYEDFDSADGYRAFTAAARQSLELAEPVAKKHGVKIAVENHKDFRVPELLDLLKRVSSDRVGVTLDTGNSIALLEDPMRVVEALAPHTLTVHFKDVSAAEAPDGFLLSEVPLGEGFLDLPKVIETIRRGNPSARLNLEMITRDPLRIPCLGEKYWATLRDVPAPDLAGTLAMVRKAPKRPLPEITSREPEDRLAFEELNVRKCFEYARGELGL